MTSAYQSTMVQYGHQRKPRFGSESFPPIKRHKISDQPPNRECLTVFGLDATGNQEALNSRGVWGTATEKDSQMHALPHQASSMEAYSSSIGEGLVHLHHQTLGYQDRHLSSSATEGKPRLRRKLEDWSLPAAILQAYAAKGVVSMYPWQAAALEDGATGENLVYCAPTSGGKSLVAELLLIRRLLASKGKPNCKFSRNGTNRALFVLPYLSVVKEKTAHLCSILGPCGIRVKGYTDSGQVGTPLPAGRGEAVAVCSIEKSKCHGEPPGTREKIWGAVLCGCG
eukprot:jgi/Botrbrau1/1326/Bobra.0063s0040.1